MKKFPTQLHKLFLLTSCLLVSPTLFAITDEEAIWSYVFLIPVYFVLILQSLLVLLALIMKQFNSRKLLIISLSIGSVMIAVGLAVAFYFASLIDLNWHLIYFIALAIVTLVFPTIQYKLLNKDEISPMEE